MNKNLEPENTKHKKNGTTFHKKMGNAFFAKPFSLLKL